MKNTNELYSGCFITLFFGLIIWLIIPSYIDKVNFLPPTSPGPDAWPKIVAYFGFSLGLLLIIKSINKKSIKDHSIKKFIVFLAINLVYIKRVFYLFVLFSTYYVSIDIIGMVLSSSFFLIMLLLSNTNEEDNKKTRALLAVFLPIFLYFAFKELSNTSFPIGSIWSTFGLN